MYVPIQSASVDRRPTPGLAQVRLVRAAAVRRPSGKWTSPGDYNTCYRDCIGRGGNPISCLNDCWPIGGTGPFNPFPTIIV